MSSSNRSPVRTPQARPSPIPQPGPDLQTQVHVSRFEEKMFWSIRWFLLITLVTGYLTSLVTGIVGFALTRDFRFLTFLSPTALMPFILYLVPLDDKRYHLKLRKIETKAEIRVQQLLLKQQRQQQRSAKKEGD